VGDQEQKTAPLPCVECKRAMNSPMVCASCGALNPLPPDTFNHFELFDMEPSFDLDEQMLHQKYLSLSRSVHPDIAGREPGKIRKRSLTLSSELNRAYDTLRDHTSRAEYLLSLAGGPSAADDKSVPPELLGEIVMLREAIEEAITSNDREALYNLKQPIAIKRQAILEQIAQLCRSLEPGNTAVHKQLRSQLNAIKYWNNLMDQLPTGAYRDEDDHTDNQDPTP